MFLRSIEITTASLVSEIVKSDYRTADIFMRHEIEYCCGGNLPLETACNLKGIEPASLITEIENSTRSLQLSANLPFHKWSIDFLVDYIIHVHHYYVEHALPVLGKLLRSFAYSHIKKYPMFQEIATHFDTLEKDLTAHIQHEEKVIFPYLRQVAHAYERQDHYAKLLVKTLRKPISLLMDDDHRILNHIIYKFRELTNHYAPDERSCTNHYVILSKLKEFDNDLMQHIYLENNVLFPRVISMEKELLSKE
jgi:regulator of cell morphogenesis and NO signaling